MDKELKHGRMYPVLKTEQETPPPRGQAVLKPQVVSVESDTESLAQERAYQQQLQTHTGHQDLNKYILPQKENTDILQQVDGEDEYASDDETEDHLVYDSLKVAAHPHIKRNPTLLQTEYLDTQRDDRNRMGQPLSDDAYSDLRYDPNWRTNLKGAGCFDASPQSSVEEYHQFSEEKSSQICCDRQELVIKGGYRYISDTSPAVVVTPHMAANECDQPYRLHPQDDQIILVTSLHRHDHARQCRSPVQECQPDSLHEPRRTQGEPVQTQQMNTSALKSWKVLSNKKLDRERLTEDIVERNKITLGRHTSKCGSYVRVHAPQQEMPQNVNKVHEALKETATAESQEDSSNPELRWLQKTQQLRVTQISKGMKAQRKENPRPSRLQQLLAPEVKAEQGDCLSSPLARPAAVTQPKPQKTTSSQPLPPTIHLNINLNTSSQLIPLLQQKAHDAIMNLASLHSRPHWSPGSEVQLVYQQRNPGKFTHMCLEALHTKPHHRNQENTLNEWQSPNKPFPQNIPRTPTSTYSQGSGSYAVLPPIGKTEMELCPGQSVNTTYPTDTSSADGYLAQMEKQKQLRARVTYKAYSLKDYKQLMPDVTLQGLGPDYTAVEKTALEYAKTIAKPMLREKHQSEGFTERTPRLEGLDVSQLASLERLRKRHEEEKQAVALFRKVHAV
ncbi:hypothetical protein PAMA_006515 [Pampus argenteus]